MRKPIHTLPLIVLSALLCDHQLFANVQADLNEAANNLRQGRNYLVGFPQSKTRNTLRMDYLGVDTNGASSGSASKFTPLQTAIDQAVAVRTDPVQATLSQKELAQLIAWESLEAMLQGQLVAGNANLLKGLRTAFPNATGDGERPGGETALPPGCPCNSTGVEYNGSHITDLCYARLHFLRGIMSALEFMANDSSGEIRAVDLLNDPFTQYTTFNTPYLVDSNFPPNQSSQTVGYLLGNTLDRYGQAMTAIGDRLWRAAYFDKERGPNGSRSAERQQMLDAAMAELQRSAHSQFMAALPLAATLEEGELGYEKCRVDQVRVTVAAAATFIDRIRRGEIPKLNNLALAASVLDVQQRIRLVGRLQEDAAAKYGLAETAIWRKKDAEQAVIGEAQQLRLQFGEEIVAATGLNPGGESEPPYFGLRTKEGRECFRSNVSARIAQMYQEGISSTNLTDGSELGQAFLQVLRASADIASAKNRIDSIPQQILVEEERVGAVNGVILETMFQVEVYQFALEAARSINVSEGINFGVPPSVSFSISTNPNWMFAALFQDLITLAQTFEQVEINNINAAATVRNLLLQQNQYILDLKSSVAQGQLASAALNQLLARVDRLIENHIYYQTSNDQKWYNDPALIFDQEKAEIDYENARREYVAELYNLSQMLATRWSEPFQNPYLKADATSFTLGQGAYDDFTQAESVFNVYEAADADRFFLALQQWDTELRPQRQGGQAEIQSLISLRQDIFGLSDVVYNTARSQFETSTDQAFLDLNKRKFRALLLRYAQLSASPYWLRLEFPLTYNQRSKKCTGAEQRAIILASRTDWNIRVTEMSAKVIGDNVAQSSFNTLRLDLYQYGKIEIPTYHPRQNDVYPNFLTFNLPLYYPDPEDLSISSFKFSLSAGINGQSGILNPFIPDIQPTPYCDRYVLLIERQANPPINIENIEDIEITLRWRSSIPPTFF